MSNYRVSEGRNIEMARTSKEPGNGYNDVRNLIRGSDLLGDLDRIQLNTILEGYISIVDPVLRQGGALASTAIPVTFEQLNLQNSIAADLVNKGNLTVTWREFLSSGSSISAPEWDNLNGGANVLLVTSYWANSLKRVTFPGGEMFVLNNEILTYKRGLGLILATIGDALNRSISTSLGNISPSIISRNVFASVVLSEYLPKANREALSRKK